MNERPFSEIEHQFERATEFLFQVKLCVGCDTARKDTKADGRLPLEDRHTILFDCKSVEGMVNLHAFLDTQFDGYLRKERESGMTPLAFMVIGRRSRRNRSSWPTSTRPGRTGTWPS